MLSDAGFQRGGRAVSSFFIFFRKQYDERGAFAGLADHVNGSAVAIHNFFADGESHAGAFKQSIVASSFKGVKDQIDLVGFDADAIVLDHDFPEPVA